MSICGEIEISLDELTTSLDRLSRTSDLITKIRDTLDETIRITRRHKLIYHRKVILWWNETEYTLVR